PVRIRLRHAGLPEVFAHHDVGGELRPVAGDLRIVHLKHDAAVGVADAAGALLVLDAAQGVLSGLGESACDLHDDPSLTRVALVRATTTPKRRGHPGPGADKIRSRPWMDANVVLMRK